MNTIFVYGTLKRGRGNHRFLGHDSQFLGPAELRGWRMISLGPFPAILRARRSSIVHGEVFRVSNQALQDLDRLEGHPAFFERITVTLQDGREAQAYRLPRACGYEGPEVKGGSW